MPNITRDQNEVVLECRRGNQKVKIREKISVSPKVVADSRKSLGDLLRHCKPHKAFHEKAKCREANGGIIEDKSALENFSERRCTNRQAFIAMSVDG
jgi:hypothetical protein